MNKIDIQRVGYHYSWDRIKIVSLWRRQQSIVTSSAERRPSEWDTGTMCKDHFFVIIYGYVNCIRNKIMYVISSRTVSTFTQVLFLCLFPSLLRNSGNKWKNNPLVRAETTRHSSTYILLYWWAVEYDHWDTLDMQDNQSAINSWPLPSSFGGKTAKNVHELLSQNTCLDWKSGT